MGDELGTCGVCGAKSELAERIRALAKDEERLERVTAGTDYADGHRSFARRLRAALRTPTQSPPSGRATASERREA